MSNSSYTSRRTYLLNRAAWGMIGFALLYALFGGEYKSWWIVIGCVAVAAFFWFIAGRIEKKRRIRHSRSTDEEGNARPNKL